MEASFSLLKTFLRQPSFLSFRTFPRKYSFINQTFNSTLYTYCKTRKCSASTASSRYYSNLNGNSRKYVLGIETSCDDTGAAVVDDNGVVIGEALQSQTSIHNETGGIIPNVAKELHAQNVDAVVTESLANAGMKLQDVDAIAVTVEPGLIMSLRVGMRYAQQLAMQYNKPIIPIHHMEAHALTARMIEKIEFPFLVLLASGGHCLLALARDIDDFLLMGTSLDVAPGDAYDKTARELNLWKLPHLQHMPGGAAVEQMAKGGNCHSFPLIHVMSGRANCNFSFTGLKISARRKIRSEYERLGLPTTEILPNVSDICAWFQYNVTYHIGRRLQRAFIYSDMMDLLGNKRTLVLSGGVASNQFIRSNLDFLCGLYDCRLVCPPIKLCTDNGIMIAWNGMEKLLSGRDYFVNPADLDVKARSPLGTDITREVGNCSIKLPKLSLKTY